MFWKRLTFEGSKKYKQMEAEIEIAINELDVMSLRNKLYKIKQFKNIWHDDLAMGLILEDEADEWLLKDLSNLKLNILLNNEIDAAIKERDVIVLRSALMNIVAGEQSRNEIVATEIDDYLIGNDNIGQKELFESQIRNNSLFKKEVALHDEINHAISEADILNLRNELKKVTGKQVRIIPFVAEKKGNYELIIKISASVAAVFVLGFFLLKPHSTSSLSEIYSKEYKPYALSVTSRSMDQSNAISNVGIELYNQGKYALALENFFELQKQTPGQPWCNFYIGLAYQGLNEYDNAILYYQKVVAANDNLFVEQAQWYQALCLLKVNDTEKAQKLLSVIADQDGFFSKQAKTLLKKIKS
jgi:tetratricopeptide (TPR) repeat protein